MLKYMVVLVLNYCRSLILKYCLGRFLLDIFIMKLLVNIVSACLARIMSEFSFGEIKVLIILGNIMHPNIMSSMN